MKSLLRSAVRVLCWFYAGLRNPIRHRRLLPLCPESHTNYSFLQHSRAGMKYLLTKQAHLPGPQRKKPHSVEWGSYSNTLSSEYGGARDLLNRSGRCQSWTGFPVPAPMSAAHSRQIPSRVHNRLRKPCRNESRPQ